MTVTATTIEIGVVAALVIGALAGVWRGLRFDGRRFGVLAASLQLPAAALLYLALYPPTTPGRGDALSLITAGATAEQLDALPAGQPVVALPEAPTTAEALPVPDLATVLRQFPKVTSLDVYGDGLPARDRPAAGVMLRFHPSTARGFLALAAPTAAALGTRWTIRGRVAAAANGESGRSHDAVARVELRDPSGAIAAAPTLDSDGRFTIGVPARGAGELLFQLRALRADGTTIDHISLPLAVHGGVSLNIIVRAGVVNPDLKYWRRWAADSGLKVGFAAGLSRGTAPGASGDSPAAAATDATAAPLIALHDGDASLNAGHLAATDLVMIDDRGWLQLGADEKSALTDAVRQGLGLLLVESGPLAPEVATDWSSFGYHWDSTDDADDADDGQADSKPLQMDGISLTLAPIRPLAGDAVASGRADDGRVLGSWRPFGDGRVGAFRVIDSYRLVLGGDLAGYGSLWSSLLGSVARARDGQPPRVAPQLGRIDSRSTLCGLRQGAKVAADAGGEPIPLAVDGRGCAAFWPDRSGWMTVLAGGDDEAAAAPVSSSDANSGAADAARRLFVRDRDDGLTLAAAADRAATAAAAAASPVPSDNESSAKAAGSLPKPHWPRTPLFLVWLLLAGGIWWLERQPLVAGKSPSR